MAKNKNKQRKKRIKRYMKKMKKQLHKLVKNKEAATVQDRYYPPYKEPIIFNIHEEYEAQKKLYQLQLNEKYGGTVTAIKTFVNYQSIILHQCSECNKEFHARPEWLLYKENQQHICGVDTARTPMKIKKNLTETDIKEMIMLFKEGMSQTKIASHFGVSRPTVINHLRKAGL